MACADRADPAHRRAVQARDRVLEAGKFLVTTDYVVDETLTLIRLRLSLAAAEKWWNQLERSARLLWEWIEAVRAAEARDIFFRYRDKKYSFTDCTSFVVMKELKLRQVLTTDRHFRQMGFELLPT